MLKKFVAKLSIIAVLTFSLGQGSMAVYAATPGQDVQLNNMLKPINSTAEVESIIQKAKMGTDDLLERKGYDFNVSAEYEGAISSEAAVNTLSDTDNLVETYQMSEYLGNIKIEGEQSEVYALRGITTYSDESYSDTKTNGGCTIVTTIYIAYGTGSKIEARLLRSEAYITGTLRPTLLQMQNHVHTGAVTMKDYYNSKNVNYPSNGIYTLSPGSNVYVSDYFAFMAATDSLSFGDGGKLTTSVTHSPF